jgi:very-short-patch-repair endonuclease
MPLNEYGENGWRNEFPSYQSDHAGRTESPIELRMLRALAAASWPNEQGATDALQIEGFKPIRQISRIVMSDVLLSLDAQIAALKPRIVISTQAPVLIYRLDILVEAKLGIINDKTVRMAVECDGKAYHSNPEQRNRDASRDGILWRHGIRTMRFTGGQIMRDATSCARKVVESVLHAHWEAGREQ